MTLGMTQLSDPSTANFKSLIGGVTLGGSTRYDVILPIQLTTGIAGISPVLATISARSPDLPAGASDLGAYIASIPDNIKVSSDLADLLSIRNVSLDQLLNGLISALDTLADPNGILFKNIPGVNKRIIDLLGGNAIDFIAQLKGAVTAAKTAIHNLQDVQDSLNAQFNAIFGADTNPVTLEYVDNVFRLEFNLVKAISKSLPFDVNLSDYVDLSAIGNAIDLSASSNVDVTASASVKLGLKLDVSNAPRASLFH